MRVARSPSRSSLAALLTAATLAVSACSSGTSPPAEPFGQLPSAVTTAEPLWIPFSVAAGTPRADDPRESKLASVRQLTGDGKSSSAVWHPSGTKIFFVSRAEAECGRVMLLDLVTGKAEPVSTAEGWSASPHVMGERLVYLHGTAPPCAPAPGQLDWQLGKFDVWGGPVGKPASKLLDDVVELGASGSQLVFTSTRDGDPEVYASDATGAGVRRLTRDPGYAGGASVAPNGGKIAWHEEPIAEADRDAYKQRATDRVAPRRLRVVVAGASGQEPRVLSHGARSMWPSFLPDSQRILFSSSADDDGPEGSGNFEIYLADPDGPTTTDGGPRVERITFGAGFDGEAQLSPDGKYVLFTSGRASQAAGGVDVFVARWLGD